MKLMLAICLAVGLTVSAMAQTDNASMKAIVVHQYGGPEVLKLEDAPRPQPGPGEIVIRVMAAGVNPVDAYIRAGRFGSGKLPYTPGFDVAGVVEATGANVKKFKKGDAVYAYLDSPGAYAEFCTAKESEASLKPKNISFEQAAAVPLAGTTAWQALFDTAKLKAGQTVLIHGGSGGVGHLAVQIAKAKGAKVIATASTENQGLLKQIGVDQPIDYTKTKFEDVAKNVDVVLDATRSDALQRSYAVVKKGGFVVTITGSPDPAELEKHGISGSSLMAHPDSEVLEQFRKLIEEKKVKPTVSETYPLADASKAHQQIETRHTRGKIVLKVTESR